MLARRSGPGAAVWRPARIQCHRVPALSCGWRVGWQRGRRCAGGRHRRQPPRGPVPCLFRLACPRAQLTTIPRRCGSLQALAQPLRARGATGKRPVHDDGDIDTLDLNTNVGSGLYSYRLYGRIQGDRHKGLLSTNQYALAVFAQPAVHDVGVDAVLQCHPGNGRAGLGAGCDNLQLEFGAVEPSLGGLGGASVARQGVHDVHRAHYLRISVVLQYVLAGRIPANFHLKVESLSLRRSTKSQAYITAPALVAELNRQRSAKLAHSWRAALMTILCCDWAQENGVTAFDQNGQLVDWNNFDDSVIDLQVFHGGRRVDAGFCFIATAEGLCTVSVADGKPHRVLINPLLLTTESGFRHGDTLDLAYHEVSHLWEQHHGEAFCSVEGKLRQSVRRWMTERELLANMAG